MTRRGGFRTTPPEPTHGGNDSVIRINGSTSSRSSEQGSAEESADRIDILLVDDSTDYLLLIQRTLERFDPRYRITGVGSPEEAYALLEERSFQLVLLDYKFPRGGNGLQVIRNLKGKAFFIPTVMITAFGDESLAIQAMREGALDFIPKTSDFLQALPEVAARAIERGRTIRERIRAREELERRHQELQVLYDVSSAINEAPDPDALLTVAVRGLRNLLGATCACTHVVDGANVRLIAHDGSPECSLEDCPNITPPSTDGRVVADRTPEVFVQRLQALGRGRAVVPLVSKEKTVAMLSLVLPKGRELTDSERTLAAAVGHQVGVALEHARLHRALQDTQAYLTDLVENAGDEVVTIDRTGNVITWNTGAEATYGYTAREIVGRPWTLLWPEDRRSEAATLVATVVDGAETVRNHETARVTRSGASLDILLTLSPLRNPDGTIRGVSCLGKNITFRKQLQAQLIQSEKMAAVGQLISGVAHELNNPLTGVLGYAQLVGTVETGDRLKQYLAKIANEAGRCQKIVQNLLTFARKHEPRATRIDINAIVRETIDLRSYDLRVNNVELVADLGTRLPTTMADAHQLQQVFVNVINNAQQAMVGSNGKGRLVISTRHEDRALGGGPALVITFDDDGPGIPAPLRKKVFDPFFTTKAVGEGTGLGLSLSYGIVQEHGGDLRVGDSPEGGARFELLLPVLPELVADTHSALPARKTAGKIAPKRILVVDDQETIREMFTDILARDGHVIDSAEDGRKALHLIETRAAYDLIIVDLRMPDFSGDRLYRELREIHPEVARRMLFASGDVVSAETRRFLEGTGNKFLPKPFGVEEVRSTVSSFFEDSS